MVFSSHRGAPFMQAVTNTAGTYTVPARRTLVLTGVRVDVPTTAGTNSLSMNGAVLHSVTMVGAASATTAGSARLTPMPIKSGEVLTFQTSGAGVTGTLIGYLIDET